MKLVSLAVTAASVGQVAAFWRMPCRSTTGVGRLDPIVTPGQINDHVHIAFGSGGFGMSTDYKTLANSDCTSCGVEEDKSAYWTPPLYFQYKNGTTVMVPNVGGMLAYYLPYLDNIKAFPEGFRMLAGNPRLREFNGSFPDAELSSWPTDPTDQFFLQQRAIGFNCLNYKKAPEPSLYRHDLPNKAYLDANCADGVRMEMAFPSCGNGELDSDDHKSHILYPSLVKEGNCPKGYDIHYPFIFYETIWATNAFIGQDGEFVLSPGDPSGAGYHADFFMGWKSEDFLQKAIDECTNQSGQIQDCPLFTLQSDSDAAKCTFDMPKELKDDDATGPCEGLPVGVPVQYGPEMATKYAVPGRDSASTSVAPKPPTPSTYSEKPVAPYTSAAASLVSTALGGIILGAAPGTDAPVAASQPTNMRAAHAVNSDTSSAPSPAAPSPATTPPPVAQPASNNKIIATSYITQGNEIIEVMIEQELITTTATQVNQVYNKRHLHQHLHHNKF